MQMAIKGKPAALPDGKGVASDEELQCAYAVVPNDIVAVLAAWVHAQDQIAQQQIDQAIWKNLCRQTGQTLLIVVTLMQIHQWIMGSSNSRLCVTVLAQRLKGILMMLAI